MTNNNIEKVIQHLENDKELKFESSEELKKVLEEMLEGKVDPDLAIEKYLDKRNTSK